MPYQMLGDIHRINIKDGFSSNNITLILTMDNFIVFHDDIITSESAGLISILPEYCRPKSPILFKVIATTQTLDNIGDAIIELNPDGQLALLSNPIQGETVLHFNGVIVSVSDFYYDYTSEQGFENTAPTTAVALKMALDTAIRTGE